MTSLEEAKDTVACANGMAAIVLCMELFESGDHYIETPSNPTMQITDLAKMKSVADKYYLLVIVDNTFLSPYFQKPIRFGADIVIHSGTKFLGGHNDTLAGFLSTSRDDLAEKIRYLHKTVGSCLAPFDSYLLIRGIKTFGSMISIRTDSEATARRVLERIRLITYAESLGGVESLMTYPMLQTHGDVPVETRERLGITEDFLRFSVGIENVDDLIADLDQALNGED